jgi:hypothetical protein
MLKQLTQLVVWEYFIIQCHRESYKSCAMEEVPCDIGVQKFFVLLLLTIHY